jgi:hypothetical protein
MTQPPMAATVAPLAPPTDPGADFSLVIRRYRDHQQIVDFRMPGVAVLGLDQPAPLGRGWGPSPAQLLGSALGACLGAALLDESRRLGIEVIELRTEVDGTLRTDALGARHLASLAVRLSPVLAQPGDVDRMPEPSELADRSMIADSMRADLGLWIEITPEVRPKAAALTHGARPPRPAADRTAPSPRFFELTTRP